MNRPSRRGDDKRRGKCCWKLGESVAGRVEKRCAKLERTKGAFLSGDPKRLRFDAEKNCSGKSIMYTAPGCRDADTLISIYIFLLIIFLILYLPLNQRNLLQLLSVFIGLFALCQFSFLQPS